MCKTFLFGVKYSSSFMVICKKIILLFFLFINSCTRLPSGQGEYNEVIILCSPEDRINIEPIITDFFDKSIYTPQLEKEIKINWKQLGK